MSNAIEATRLWYRAGGGFRANAQGFQIKDMNLRVPSGSIYGFLGPNGSGKTTTIRLLLGMSRRLAGDVTLLGHRSPEELPSALAKIGYVPERPHLYPTLTVSEAMRFHSVFYPKWDAQWATRLQNVFELPYDRRIGKLSKGETGKLMILLALAQRPELLILDEPTDGLDPAVRRDVLAAVIDYVGDAGATVFISSHLVHELERMCDWVGVLDKGRLVTEMPIAQFKAGVKRIRLIGAPAQALGTPFELLSRVPEALSDSESWVVRGWDDPMREYFDARGARIREISDLDLEEVFVEMLRSSRQGGPQ